MKNNFSTYIVSTTEESPWGIKILNTGKQFIPSNSVYPPQNHPAGHFYRWKKGRILREYQILYIKSGSGEFESVTTGSISFEGPAIFIIFPGVWHRYRPETETGWLEYWIGFNGSICQNITSAHLITPANCFFPDTVSEEYSTIFHKIETLAKLEGQISQLKITALVYNLLISLATENLPKSSSNRNESWLSSVCSKIQEMATEKINWEQLASHSNMSYSLFRKKFKELTGLAPKQYQNEIRFRNACWLLDDTDKSVQEISQDLGFDTQFHFSSKFKAKYGKSPLQWRKRKS